MKVLDVNARAQTGDRVHDPEESAGSVPRVLAARAAWPEPPGPLAYHGLAGRIVKAVAPHTEADPVAILIQLLTAFGNAIGRGPHFRVESSRHYPCLNVVLVGQTAKGRKGTSWDHVFRLFAEVDESWARNCVQSGLSSGEGLISAVRDEVYKKEPIRGKGKIITGYQNVLSDPGVADKRLLALQAEFVHVLKVASREGNTLSATIRQAWDTGTLRVLTKNNPAVATDAHISMVGHITRDELRRHLEQTEAANGFANRFLWICVRRSQLLPEGGGFADQDVSAFVRDLRHAVKDARQRGHTCVGKDEAATQLWREVYPQLSSDRPGMTGAVLGRAEAQTMRLALIYALLDCSPVIAEVHLRAALSVWDFAERSVRYIFGDSTGDRVADEVMRALRASPDGRLTRTEISDGFGRNRDASQIGQALEMLSELSLARRLPPMAGRGPGRAPECWEVVRPYERDERNERNGGPPTILSSNSSSSYLPEGTA